MSVRHPYALLRHLLFLSVSLQCAAPATLPSHNANAEDTTTVADLPGVAPRQRDVRTRRTSGQLANLQQPPARILQQGGDDDDGTDDDAAKVVVDDEDCKGSKFQIIIHFDAYPEDFAMRLRNDVTNKTIWAFDDPDHTYPASQYQHKTVAAGVCLPRDWCWVLTVSDRFGDGMVGNDLTTPSNGGGFRILFNGLTVNYYTGKFNGCYKTMWFRFGEWCSAQEQFWYEPGDASCGNFTVGHAPDDGWFEGDLYQVGPGPPSPPQPAPAPAPAPPVAVAPVRVVLPATPVPQTTGPPARVGPTDRPVQTAAPVRSVAPTGRPSYAMRPTADDPTADALTLSPTDEPLSSSPPSAEPTDVVPTSPPSAVPTDVVSTSPPSAEPSAAVVPASPPSAEPSDALSTSPRSAVPSAAVQASPRSAVPSADVPAPSQPPAKPVLCHFRYCN